MRIWETTSGNKIIQILSGRSNVFLLTNGEKNILIDTSPKLMWNTLVKRLKQLNVNRIDYLILTHTHYDHAYEPYLYLIDQLSPKAIYLMGDKLVTKEHSKCVEVLRARNIPVAFPEGGLEIGERFHFPRDSK